MKIWKWENKPVIVWTPHSNIIRLQNIQHTKINLNMKHLTPRTVRLIRCLVTSHICTERTTSPHIVNEVSFCVYDSFCQYISNI